LLRGNKEHQKELLDIYDGVNTIQDFFAVIKEKIENGEIDFNIIIEPWLEEFIKDQMQFRFMFQTDVKWVIEK
jgi:hypothetical protein